MAAGDWRDGLDFAANSLLALTSDVLLPMELDGAAVTLPTCLDPLRSLDTQAANVNKSTII